jgi:tRNA threonylcarbamoyladenosine biosynthesis protein TsaE
VFVTHSGRETIEVARAFSARLEGGDVLLLSGSLGAGKTAFVKGVAEGLGLDPAEITSPTFTLVHEYRGGRLALYHADLYRLDKTAAEDLGLEETVDGVLAVEWPDRLSRPCPPATVIEIEIEILGARTRRISVRQPDSEHR